MRQYNVNIGQTGEDGLDYFLNNDIHADKSTVQITNLAWHTSNSSNQNVLTNARSALIQPDNTPRSVLAINNGEIVLTLPAEIESIFIYIADCDGDGDEDIILDSRFFIWPLILENTQDEETPEQNTNPITTDVKIVEEAGSRRGNLKQLTVDTHVDLDS